ncbi:c-type cytochrome biogenesis protein CcmI [Solimonas variicoloris]|uniref:c-type cytochrome biogenesis protein CcmI n=1 Tax=Solimonas variicoloris TaxID=254408 RepID=UPI00037500F4|nr:c-type cytochrome biogenesis protein CcmI [Solimonas variicoloris]
MTLLIVVMAAIAVAAGLWLTRPLWARATAATLRRKRANVIAYETRVAEIDADVAAGTLDAESAQQLRDEAGARLLDDAAAAAEAGESAPRRRGLALALVLLLGALAGLGYWLEGSWRTRALIELAQRDPQAAEQQMIDGMVGQLERRLKSAPDDAQGWAMLGRAYLVLQRYSDAAQAYSRANALSVAQPQAEWLIAAGAAQGMANPQRDLRPARPLFEQALTLDPGNVEALWYAGLAALQADDAAAAYAHWLKLRELSPPEDLAAILDQQLPALAAKTGQTLPPKPAAAPSGVQLTVHVRLADALRAQLKPGMTLMVFAKAENGPPMPLAVQRIASPQLPLSVTLDDSQAMMPAMKLSAFERWVVTARLTSGAGAQALSGDLEGSHPASRAEAGSPLELVIDRQVP